MKKKMMVVIALCIFMMVARGLSGGQGAPLPAAGKAANKDKCLSYHSWDQLSAGAPGFRSTNGEKVSPHVYVPHKQKDAGGIPDCKNCHVAHPVPLTSKAGLMKANVEWCFSCHHTGELKACAQCHAQ